MKAAKKAAPPLTFSVTHGEFEDDGKLNRLQTAFGRAWQLVPETARKLLTDGWKAAGGGQVLLGMGFRGFLTGIAQCERCGSQFAFHAFALEDMPDRILESLIGHELCHALLMFSGDPHHSDLDGPHTKKLREAITDAKMDEFGFSSEELRLWVKRYSPDLRYVNDTWVKATRRTRRRRATSPAK